MTDSHIRQHFAIKADLGLFEAVNQATVGQPINSGSGVDSGDPQAAQITFPCSPIPVFVPETLQHGFVGPAVETTPGAVIAFCHANDFFMPPAPVRTCFYSCHSILSCSPLGAGCHLAPVAAPSSCDTNLTAWQIYHIHPDLDTQKSGSDSIEPLFLPVYEDVQGIILSGGL